MELTILHLLLGMLKTQAPDCSLLGSIPQVMFAVSNLEGWSYVCLQYKEQRCLLFATESVDLLSSVPLRCDKPTAHKASISARITFPCGTWGKRNWCKYNGVQTACSVMSNKVLCLWSGSFGHLSAFMKSCQSNLLACK